MVNIDSALPRLLEAVKYLPSGIGDILRLFALKHRTEAFSVTEIRLRRGGCLSLSLSDENIMLNSLGDGSESPYICTSEDLDHTVKRLCGSSVHSYRDEMDKGYISAPGAFRAGVATYSVFKGSVWGIDSVCIRIPIEVTGCSRPLLNRLGICSMLVFAPPGVGKTTFLKDAVREICGVYKKRCVVCDTRFELMTENRPLLADYICGREKWQAIEMAIRTMSPQAVLCDELGGREETEAVLSSVSGGVPLIATAHGREPEDVLSKPGIKALHSAGVFDRYVAMERRGKEVTFRIYGRRGEYIGQVK